MTPADYLTSRKNLVGSALGLVGVGLSLAGIVTGVVPAVGVIGGLYAAGALATPQGRKQAADGGDAVDVDAIRRQLKQLAALANSAPSDISLKAQGIIGQLSDLLPRIQGKSDGAEDAYVISRMATRYLPDTLDAYFKLPRTYAETQKLAGGLTAHQLTLQQLDLLTMKMSEVTNAVLKGDSDALAAHGRFLAERFAPSALQAPPATAG